MMCDFGNPARGKRGPACWNISRDSEQFCRQSSPNHLSAVPCAGGASVVAIPPAADDACVAQELTSMQLCEHAPFLAPYIPDLLCSSARNAPGARLPEARRAPCTTTLAAAVLASPHDGTEASSRCGREVAAHWIASDGHARRQLAAACADRATSTLADGCASVSQHAVLSAVQRLGAMGAASDGLCHGEGLSALAWDFLRFWDDVAPRAPALSLRHLLNVCSSASSLISQADPASACSWSCSLAHALADGAASRLMDPGQEGDRVSRWLHVVLLSMLACAVSGCHRSIHCDHGPTLVGKLLCAAAGSVEDAAGVVLAVVQCEPLGALGRHLAPQRQFWQGISGEQRRVAVRPMAAMASVVLNVMVSAACQDVGGALEKAVGAAMRHRGARLWGWCGVGTDAITKLCSALVQMLVSAVDGGQEAGKACWLMCEEFQWLQKRLGVADAVCREDRWCAGKDRSGVSQSSSSSASSSEADSSSSSEAHSSGETAGEQQTAADELGSARCAALSAGREEAICAMEIAAECCGWRWTADQLVDRIVWPAVQQLHAMQTIQAKLMYGCLTRLMETLLNKVLSISDNDEVACEYVASTREALQFVS